MDKIVLQIPINVSLRNKAEEVALSQGFSSVQEIVRVFLNKLASNSLEVGFYNSDVSMSTKAEKRYSKIVGDISKNKNIVKSTGVNDLLSVLD